MIHPGAPRKRYLLGLAGRDFHRVPVARMIESEAAMLRLQLQVRLFDSPGATPADHISAIVRAAQIAGFDAVHFGESLRRHLPTFCTGLAPSALRSGVGDTVHICPSGRTHCHDLEGVALESALAAHGGRGPGSAFAGPVLLRGAGARARTALAALVGLGTRDIGIADPDPQRARALAQFGTECFGIRIRPLDPDMARAPMAVAATGDRQSAGAWCGIVNTIPWGRGPSGRNEQLWNRLLASRPWVADTGVTGAGGPFLRAARAFGCCTHSALDLLPLQGALLLEVVTGQTADRRRMGAVLRASLPTNR